MTFTGAHIVLLISIDAIKEMPIVLKHRSFVIQCISTHWPHLIFQVFDEAVRAVLKPEPMKRRQRKCIVM